MEEYKKSGKSKFGIKVDEIGNGRWAFGLNLAYENFYDLIKEFYLNIYLGKYQISIVKMYKGEHDDKI